MYCAANNNCLHNLLSYWWVFRGDSIKLHAVHVGGWLCRGVMDVRVLFVELTNLLLGLSHQKYIISSSLGLRLCSSRDGKSNPMFQCASWCIHVKKVWQPKGPESGWWFHLWILRWCLILITSVQKKFWVIVAVQQGMTKGRRKSFKTGCKFLRRGYSIAWLYSVPLRQECLDGI